MIPTPSCFVRHAVAIGAVGLAASCAPAWALTITFDYTYDTAGFFSGANAGRRDLLNAAAAAYTTRLGDSLSAIAPAGGNAWTATFANPSSASPGTLSLTNLSIASDTIVIYVGAVDLGAGALSRSSAGGSTASGSSAWINTVSARGQTGALAGTPTDFGPWGGSITFSSTASWYFDPNPATTEPFPNQADFYSIASHEIGHVLGLGTAGSWFAHVSGGNFTGANAVAANGGPVPLSASNDHFAHGTLSTALGSGATQGVMLDSVATLGARTALTALDLAALQDVGWAVVPEVRTLAWAAVLGAAGWLRARRGRRA